jgi:CheY-like chemotaxis protein
MNTINILLVEDNPADQKITLRAFKQAKFDAYVQIASNGEEALEYLENKGKYENNKIYPMPHVILLDINMPRMNGIEFLEHIKNDKRFKNIPVIMLTISEREKDIMESYKLGVNAYIKKPVQTDEFVNAITKLKAFVVELTVRDK